MNSLMKAFSLVCIFLVLPICGHEMLYCEENMSQKFTDSNYFPQEISSLRDIVHHPIMWKAGGRISTAKSPNGARMWVKSIENGVEVVVVYLEINEKEFHKVDEYTFVEREIPLLSQPSDVEVEEGKVLYYSGGNPVDPRRVLFERPRKKQ